MSMSSGQGNNDTSSDDLWLIALCIGGLMALIYFVPQVITGPWKYLKLGELYSMAVLPLGAEAEAGRLRAIAFLTNHAASDISWEQVSVVNNFVSGYFAYACAAILMGIGFFVMFRKTYNYTYNMDRLLLEQSAVWKRIKPWVHYKPHPDCFKGPMRSSLKPREFVEDNQLWNAETEVFDDAKCAEIFAKQLGESDKDFWQGPDALTGLNKIFFTLFCVRIGGGDTGRKEAEQILDDLAEMVANPKDKAKHDLARKNIHQKFNKYKNHPKAVDIYSKHAYVKTALASLLEAARVNGVLASCDFLWLKPKDRTLWYLLNSVGRRNSFIECGGPWAHWIAEKSVGRPIDSPMVKEAVEATKVYMGYDKESLAARR